MQFNIEWLLDPAHPAVRYLALTELLELPVDDARVETTRSRILNEPWVQDLFSGQQPDGSFATQSDPNIHPYDKWIGAHWRLVSLVELGIPAGEKRAVAALQHELNWLTGPAHRNRIKTIQGRVRRCTSQEGNALAVSCRLGQAEDPRVSLLAESLVAWQWPDGGWNCDKRPEASHSSFHESLIPTWGLFEYFRATGNLEAHQAALRAADFFMRHRLFRSERTGEPIHPEMLLLHYPPYWHYDILQALLVLSRMGLVADARNNEALEILLSKAQPDGTWRASRHYWHPAGRADYQEAAAWDRRGPNRMITLNALRVLKTAGRVTINPIGEYGDGPLSRLN